MTTPGALVATPLWADFDDQTVLINRMCNLDLFEDHYRKALDQLARDSQRSARRTQRSTLRWRSTASTSASASASRLAALRLAPLRLAAASAAWRVAASASLRALLMALGEARAP
jgi:hypothetical protein